MFVIAEFMYVRLGSSARTSQYFGKSACTVVSGTPVHLFSNVNKALFFGYFDPENMFFDNENAWFLG